MKKKTEGLELEMERMKKTTEDMKHNKTKTEDPTTSGKGEENERKEHQPIS